MINDEINKENDNINNIMANKQENKANNTKTKKIKKEKENNGG